MRSRSALHMRNPFFQKPILNSPYEYPARHWELDEQGQPTQRIIETRRQAEFITPIPKPRKRKTRDGQKDLVFDEGKGLSTEDQQYDPKPIIAELRHYVDQWRSLNPDDWKVTPETARLLQHWRHHNFNYIRPFFCQVEAVETAIWLTEVAPSSGKTGKGFLEHLANANHDANPELIRLALKLATGAGKTTVMAMLIAWQTINAVRRPGSSIHARLPGGRSRSHHSRSAPRVTTQRPGQLLREPRTGARGHARGSRTRQDRHHQLSRL
jgi:type III restriction enzyme